jgi:hypothetical protein
MCHSVRVKLSPEERAYAKRLTGFMIPAYAVVVLAIIALVAVTGGPHSGELVASASAPASTPLK